MVGDNSGGIGFRGVYTSWREILPKAKKKPFKMKTLRAEHPQWCSSN